MGKIFAKFFSAADPILLKVFVAVAEVNSKKCEPFVVSAEVERPVTSLGPRSDLESLGFLLIETWNRRNR